jgi:uncharacterized membrane protein
MKFIVYQLVQGFKTLFPHGKFRFVLILLSVISAVISVSELLVMKFFIDIVANEGDIELQDFILLGFGFFIFLAVTRLGQYFQKNYRITALAKAFRASGKRRKRRRENSAWAMAFELTNLLTHATTIAAVFIVFALISPVIAVINLLLLLIVIQIIAIIFKKQIDEQMNMRELNGSKKIRARKKYGTRVRAGETGALYASATMILLLSALLYLSYMGDLSITNTVIIFFGTRLQTNALSGSSRSLMKYARALVRSNSKFKDDES